MTAQPRPLFAVLTAVLLTPSAMALDHSGSQIGAWRAIDSPHVVTGDVQVPAGQTLAIEAGTQVLMEPGTRFLVTGTLLGNGRDDAPILLRSRELQPRAGDWEGLLVENGGAAWFRSLDLRHATNGLTVEDGGSLDARQLTVADCLEDGLHVEAEGLIGVSDSTFERNGGAGLAIDGGAPFVVDCRFRLNDVPVRMSANSYPVLLGGEALYNRSFDGILVDTAEAVASFGSWHGGSMPFVIPDDSTLRIEAGAKLGLADDACLKLGARARIEVAGDITGGASRNGTILFTSLKDDEAVGDTNRDGEASVPAKGDWSGIDVHDGGLVSLTGAELRLADDALRIFPGGRTVLLDAEIHSNQGRGIGVGAGGEAVVQDSTFHDNDTGIQIADTTGIAIGLVPGNDPTGGGNSFHCNASFDIENASAFVLQAHRNYWGATPPDASRLLGAIDTGEFLVQAPDAALARACLQLRREATVDLRFDWSEVSSCARYQLAEALRPDTVFGAISDPGTEETWLEPGAALVDGEAVRYYRLFSDLENGP